MEIQFFMPMKVPTITYQQHQIRIIKGKPVVYEPEELKAARAKYEAHLAKHAPKEKMTGPIQLHIKWCFPITGKRKNGEYKYTRPDTDNLPKLLKDVMTVLKFWHNDAQVACEINEKFWAEREGIWISVKEIKGDG